MPGRRRAREYALQALYAMDLGGSTPKLALAGVWSTQLETAETPVSDEEVAFATLLVEGVSSERDQLDRRIEQASTNWRLSRMPAVDRNILRMGAYEIAHVKDMPVSVSINEAIELAKRFGGAESRAFVNGLLDRIAAEVGRGGRRGPVQKA